jgi:hypothetical protein
VYLLFKIKYRLSNGFSDTDEVIFPLDQQTLIGQIGIRGAVDGPTGGNFYLKIIQSNGIIKELEILYTGGNIEIGIFSSTQIARIEDK